jgi:hypothetical protein
MKVLYFIADAFINTFGITKPSEKARKQAAFFILCLLILALGAAVTAGTVVHSVMH